MSGIVRGWTDAQELRALTEDKTYARVFDRTAYESMAHALPVAVVPLDDATLAGMAEVMAKSDYEQTVEGAKWEEAYEPLREQIRSRWLTGLRAALGLDGEGA